MTERRIAIIGAGPAGYTIAQELVKEGGYAIDIFEAEDAIGGAIHTGIPEFRMPKSFLDKAYAGLVEAGVRFHFNTRIGREEFAKLREEYDRVVVAIGAQVENTWNFETGKGLVAGLTLLYELNMKHEEDKYRAYKKAIVWGGGNVAMDCARSLVRLIDDVTIVYRRSLAEMPANQSEIKAAEKEGVKVAFLNNIKEINRDETGKVNGVQIVKMELGEPDESGRASTHESAEGAFTMDADLVVMAIGQKVDFKVLAEDLANGEDHDSTLANVYVAGDAWTGPKTIGNAVVEGRVVAKKIVESF